MSSIRDTVDAIRLPRLVEALILTASLLAAISAHAECPDGVGSCIPVRPAEFSGEVRGHDVAGTAASISHTIGEENE